MAGRISYYGNIIKDGLVLDLDAGKLQSYQRTGTLWNDISGFQNNGTLTNGPIFNNTNGGSILFDGTNQHISVTNSLLFANTTNLSVSIWFNFSSLPINDFSFINKGRQELPRNYWWLYYRNLGTPGLNRFIWEVGDGLGTRTSTSYFWTATANTWFNVVSTFDPTSSKIYLNGAEVASTPSTIASIAANDSLIGTNIAGYRGSLYFFPGKLNQALIYRKTLSATEVLQNYNATKGRYL
jgi:hypothetical protein